MPQIYQGSKRVSKTSYSPCILLILHFLLSLSLQSDSILLARLYWCSWGPTEGPQTTLFGYGIWLPEESPTLKAHLNCAVSHPTPGKLPLLDHVLAIFRIPWHTPIKEYLSFYTVNSYKTQWSPPSADFINSFGSLLLLHTEWKCLPRVPNFYHKQLVMKSAIGCRKIASTWLIYRKSKHVQGEGQERTHLIPGRGTCKSPTSYIVYIVCLFIFSYLEDEKNTVTHPVQSSRRAAHVVLPHHHVSLSTSMFQYMVSADWARSMHLSLQLLWGADSISLYQRSLQLSIHSFIVFRS